MKPDDTTFFVIDPDMKRRNRLVRMIGVHAQALPLETADEIGRNLPANACLLVLDHSALVDECLSLEAVVNNAAPVIAYGSAPDIKRVFAVLDMGAAGYFDSDDDEGDPTDQIFTLLKRNAASQETRRRRFAAKRKLDALSKREFEVLRAVSQGESNKSIARSLEISPRTIEIHRRNLISKLDVSCSIGAVRLALEAGL